MRMAGRSTTPPADAVPSAIRITIGLRNDRRRGSSRSHNCGRRGSAHRGRDASGHTITTQSVGGPGGIVGDGVELAIAKIHALHFLQIEGTRAAASEHCYLIATLIHAAITIDAFGDG